MPDIVLLRSPDEPDPYVEAFAEAGYNAVCEPVLRFSFPNQKSLHDRLRDDRYGGLIATSPRAGRALYRAFRDNPELRVLWSGRSAYAVGPKTAGWLRKLGLDVRGEDTGTGAALAARIAAEAPEETLLFLSGSRRRDDIPNGLKAAGVAYDEQTVYETHHRTTLGLPPPDAHPWLVFFSPSGLEAVRATGANLAEYRLAALGPTTAETLRDAGYTVAAVAETPGPEPLVAAIQKAPC